MYNVENYIQRCLESVENQNIESVDIECIIIDDCSSDGSYKIASDIISDYNGSIRFQLIRNNRNFGLSVSRNNGLKLAGRDFILFLDSDDYLMSNCIQILVNAYCNNPHADIIIGNTIEKFNNRALYSISKPLFIDNGLDARRWMLKEKKCFVWNRLIRKQIIIDNQLYFEPGIVYEDILWTYQLYAHVSSICLLPDITHVYEYNCDSITISSPKKPNLHVLSYTTTCRKMLETNYEKSLFVQQHLFIFWAILNAIDYSEKYDIDNETKDFLLITKNQLMKKVVSDRRFVLALYFLLMYYPFHKITHIRLFRWYYITISNCVEKIASLYNCLH